MLQACSSNAEIAVKPPPEVPTAKVEVTVVFASDKDQSVTAVMHGWVLGIDGVPGATCARLVGGDLSPYDVMLERRAEMATMDPAAKLTSEKVEIGPALVYVEASGYQGDAEFAGCVPANVVQPLTAVTVTLGKARVYDCTDPQTADGSLCDDGKVCTAMERCKAGKCQGGAPRNCSHIANDCNAPSCNEELGCVANPRPDNTPCSDGLYCTDNDSCVGGKCLGTQRACPEVACQTSQGCSELTQDCAYQQAPGGSSCDDGLYCTTTDECTNYGQCQGTGTLDCSSLTTDCAHGECQEAQQGCVAVPDYEYSSCTDNSYCTTSDHCDGNGNCVGTPKDCSYMDQDCKKGNCDVNSGSCVTVNVAQGTQCNDGNSSTVNDQCNGNGVCVGTGPDAGVPDAGDSGTDAPGDAPIG
jgi:hypothetical protein